jgi:hypothetical protein
MILPIGWVDSPKFLCALTETIANLTNQHTAALELATTIHHLDVAASTVPPPAAAQKTTRSLGPVKPPITYTDMYMDDFLVATQHSDRQAVCGTLFECIDAVLQPLLPADNPS